MVDENINNLVNELINILKGELIHKLFIKDNDMIYLNY